MLVSPILVTILEEYLEIVKTQIGFNTIFLKICHQTWQILIVYLQTFVICVHLTIYCGTDQGETVYFTIICS